LKEKSKGVIYSGETFIYGAFGNDKLIDLKGLKELLEK